MSADLRALIEELAQRMGLASLLDAGEDLAVLNFEEGLSLSLSLEDDSTLVLAAHLGVAPQGDVQFAEELLAANLFWRDTGGATLSMDRYSRGVFLAQRWTASQLGDVLALEAVVERFAGLVQRWLLVLPQLSGSADPAPDSAALGMMDRLA